MGFIQYDWCLPKKRLGHRLEKGGDHMKTHEGGDHLQTQERGLRGRHPSPTQWSCTSSSQNCETINFILSMAFCYGSPSRLIQSESTESTKQEREGAIHVSLGFALPREGGRNVHLLQEMANREGQDSGSQNLLPFHAFQRLASLVCLCWLELKGV